MRCVALFLGCAVFALGACGETTRDPANAGSGGSSGGVFGAGGAVGTGGCLLCGIHPLGGNVNVPLAPPCFDPSNLPNCRNDVDRTTPLAVELYGAAQLAPQVTFAKPGGSAALVEPAETPVLVLVEPEMNGPLVAVLDFELGSDALEIDAIWGGRWFSAEGTFRALALNCPASGCELFGARVGETRLRRLAAPALPLDAHVTSLVANDARLCAYGEGLWCLQDARWVNELPVETSGTLRQVVLGGVSGATNTEGWVFVQRDGSWRPWLQLGDTTALQAGPEALSVADSVGMWHVETFSGEEVQCLQSPAVLFAQPGWNDFGRNWTVLLTDNVFYSQPSPRSSWCRHTPAVMADVPYRPQPLTCGGRVNVLGFTERTLYSLLGPIDCTPVVVPPL